MYNAILHVVYYRNTHIHLSDTTHSDQLVGACACIFIQIKLTKYIYVLTNNLQKYM